MEFLFKRGIIIKKAHKIYTKFTEFSRWRGLSLAWHKGLKDKASLFDSALEKGIQEGLF